MIYIKCKRNNLDWYASYEGLLLNTVMSLLQELSCTEISVIDEEIYRDNTRS